MPHCIILFVGTMATYCQSICQVNKRSRIGSHAFLRWKILLLRSFFLWYVLEYSISIRYKYIENFAADNNCLHHTIFLKETQHTIGYGSRQTTNECTVAIIVMSLQSVIGCLFQAFMVGLVFAKLARPQTR